MPLILSIVLGISYVRRTRIKLHFRIQYVSDKNRKHLRNMQQHRSHFRDCCNAKFTKTKFSTNSWPTGKRTLLFTNWGKTYCAYHTRNISRHEYVLPNRSCRQIKNRHASRTYEKRSLKPAFQRPLLSRAVDEDWTRDLFLTKEVLYHWATTAFPFRIPPKAGQK